MFTVFDKWRLLYVYFLNGINNGILVVQILCSYCILCSILWCIGVLRTNLCYAFVFCVSTLFEFMSNFFVYHSDMNENRLKFGSDADFEILA